MKKTSTLFLKGALGVLSLLVLGFCLILFFGFDGEGIQKVPYLMRFLQPFVAVAWLSAIPIYGAIYQTFKLLNNIDSNTAFSVSSSHALKNIKHCAYTVTFLYVLMLQSFFYVADADDAPGVMIVGFLFVGAAFTVAILAAVLQKLVESAMAIKSENDLTV